MRVCRSERGARRERFARRLAWRLAPIACAAGVLVGPSQAQVVFDATLGPPGEAPLDPGGTIWQIESDRGQTLSGGGRTNLFYSFERFDVPADQTAEFRPAAGVDSIFSRVTGGDPSRIDGGVAVRVAGGAPGAPDLFLLNPEGVVFGGTTRLDLDGAFYASSASGVGFADGGFFSARVAGGALPSAAAAPTLLRFDGGPAGDLRVDGRITSNPSGVFRRATGVSLVAPNLHGSGPGVVAPQGATLQLGAVGSGAIDVPLDLRAAHLGRGFTGGGTVRLDAGAGTAFTASTLSPGSDQGRIVIRAGELVLRDGGLFAGGNGDPGSAGFAIDVSAAERIVVDGVFAKIESQSGASFGPGALQLRADRVEIVDAGGVWITSLRGAGGAGALSIEADSTLVSGAGSQILSRTRSAGAGGALVLQAGSIRLEDEGAIVSDSLESSTLDVGPTGDIALQADALVLVEGARITSVTNDDGAGGDIEVEAGSIALDGASRILAETRANAPGGAIAIRSQSLSLANRSGVTTGSASEARSGDVQIEVGSLHLASSSAIGSGAIAPVEQGATPLAGPGGDVGITARAARIEGGSQISTTTDGAGDAGDLMLDVAESLVITGRREPDQPSGLFARSGLEFGSAATGAGGAIRLRAGSLVLSDGAQINSTTVGSGRAGSIDVATREDLVVDGGRISTISSSVGTTGDLQLAAGRNLALRAGAEVVSEAPIPLAAPGLPGDPPAAGAIRISAQNDLDVAGSRIATDSARPESGTIRVEAGRVLTLLDSDLTTNVDAPSGRGGDVVLVAGALVLAESTVTANAEGSNADAGDIALVAETGLVQASDSRVEARAALGVSGQIVRSTPETNLPEELGRSGARIQTEADVLVEGCAGRRGSAGSFVIRSRTEPVESPERMLEVPAEVEGRSGSRIFDACSER